MTPGPLRRTKLVMFQRKVIDKTGEFDVETWVNVVDAWVSISPDRGREIATQGETVATAVYSIRGDYRGLESVSEEMRAIYNITHNYPEPYDDDAPPANTKVYEVLAVMPDEEFEDDIMLKAVLRNRLLSEL